MANVLQNLLIGIIGGVYSSIVVSRVFLIRSNLQEQIDYLREKFYYLGSLMVFFDVMEILLKTISDSREEIREELNNNPNYLKEAKFVKVDKIFDELKTEILDKNVNNICNESMPLVLKEKEFIQLYRETYDSVKKYSDIRNFTFREVDECKKAIQELNKKYEKCERRRNVLFIKLLIGDVLILVLLGILLLLVGLYVYCIFKSRK